MHRYFAPVLACLTLGLAPFLPQPHIIEKLRWLVDGRGLSFFDWGDLVFHGAPWAWLVGVLIVDVRARLRGQSPPPAPSDRSRRALVLALIGAVICVSWALLVRTPRGPKSMSRM